MSAADSNRIAPGSRLSLHFSLALESGELIDSNFDKAPASFRLGDGSMLPGFEALLRGLTAGQEVERLIPAVDAFGAVNPDNVQRFPRARFQHLFEDDLVPTEVGSVVSFTDPGGNHIPGVVRAIDANAVEVDFNHPLAGKNILFRARIADVMAPDQDVVEVKL